jgi:type IV pilus assembly protein PilM
VQLFASKNPNLLGVDISSTAIKLLELGPSGNGYRVESYAVEPLPPNAIGDKNIADVDVVGEAIGRALAKSGSRTKTAACAVPGSTVITKVITVGAELSEDEIGSQIELEADQHIPFPLEEVRLDYEVLGPNQRQPDRVDVLLAASRSENVEQRVAALQAGGLTAKVVDIETFALENAFNLLIQADNVSTNATVAILDVGASITTLTVSQNNKVVYTREQAFGGRQLTEEIQRRYGLTYEEAGKRKRLGGLPDNYGPEVLEPFKEAMAQQINRALQFFYANSQLSGVDKIFLAGGCAMIPGAAELIAFKTGNPVVIANPFKNMDIGNKVRKEVLLSDAPAMMVACGLALRSFN